VFVVSDNRERFLYNYFADEDHGREHDVLAGHTRRVDCQVTLRFELRASLDPFAISVDEFMRLFRIPQHLVIQFAGILSPYMHERSRRIDIPVEIKVRERQSFCFIYCMLAG